MADKINPQVWPPLPEDVHPAVKQRLDLLFNALLDHRQAFEALKAQQTSTNTTVTTVVEQVNAAPGGGGDVFGPPAANPGDIAVFADASGKRLGDSSVLSTDLATKIGVQEESYVYAVDTGTANAYVIALTPAITAYVAGQEAVFIVGHTNTAGSTLDAGGGAKSILKMSGGALVALAAGDFTAGQLATVKYDGTQWQTPSSGGTSVSVNGSNVASPNFNDSTPAAGAGNQNVKWQVSASNVSAEVVPFVASGASHAAGIVPDPGASAGTTKFLREDASFAVPPGTFTAAGDLSGTSTSQEVIGILNKLIDAVAPPDGTVLQYQAGTGKWELVYVANKFPLLIPGSPTSGQTVFAYSVLIGQTLSFAANFANATGMMDPTNGVNPAATQTFTVKKTISSVTTTAGTITISTSGVYTFATTGGLAFSLGGGDSLQIVNQSPADTTLAYPFFTIPAFMGATVPTQTFSSGSVSGPGTSVVNDIVLWDSTNGTVTKDSTVAISTSVANNNTTVPTGAGIETYIAAQIAAVGAGWTSYTPVVAALSGTFTSASATGRYQQIGKMVMLSITLTITTLGTAGTGVITSLPVNAKTGAEFVGSGREVLVTGNQYAALILPSNVSIGQNLFISKYDGTPGLASGLKIIASVFYETN